MKSGLLVACLTVGALLVVSTHSWSQTDPPRTAWGAPDLRGIWNHGTATPLERPERHAGREFLTDEEIAAVNAEARSTEGVGARRAVWWERGDSDGRTALIVEPSDGRIPYTTEVRARSRPEARMDGPEDLNRVTSYAAAGGLPTAPTIAITPTTITAGTSTWPATTVNVSFSHQYLFLGPMTSWFGGSLSAVTLTAASTMRNE